VVSRDLAVEDAAALSRYLAGNGNSLRVASEYVNLADRYARENHLGHYRIIPTWGASEAFLPDDADLLIENTETGRTIARHNLKIIDTLFVSTACLIGNKTKLQDSSKEERIKTLINRMRSAVGDD
jgi:ATP phosphoribosyltransferase